jgi:hypothetical protein
MTRSGSSSPGVGTGTATLDGTVGAGASSTGYFQYGTSVTYGTSTPGRSIGASTGSSSLSAVVGVPFACNHLPLPDRR